MRQSSTRRSSLHRLRTAFTATFTSGSPVTATSTTSSVVAVMPFPAPASRSRGVSPSTRASSRPASSVVSESNSLLALLALRRQPSELEFELEEERRSFGAELGMFEPRPAVGFVRPASSASFEQVAMPGIFEVMEGAL